MARVKLEKIDKYFGKLKAVDNLSLDIKEGEFFSLLGPSGCGKTTTLRIVAGFIKPDKGDIYFGDNCITDLPAHKRNTGMVFQDYALFPSLNVYNNIAYGLRARKKTKKEVEIKVKSILEKVELQGLEKRPPSELSGGQQQRVALARALVIEPEVLLMDEPLSNLDANLRLNMREVIKRLQKEVGITTIFVTHDQEEAISVSERVAIVKDGYIEQIGTPADVYRNPKNLFVAEFLGSPNLLDAEVISYDADKNLTTLGIDGQIIRASVKDLATPKVVCCLRPEQIEIVNANQNCINKVKGRVLSVLFMGSMIKYKVIAFKDRMLKIEKQNTPGTEVKKEGEEIFLKISQDFSVLQG